MDQEFERLESQLLRAGRNFEYPPTPAAGSLPERRIGANTQVRLHGQRRLRFVWVAALAVLALLVLALSAPTVRAAVAEFLQIGVVRIFQGAPATEPPIPTSPPTALPATASVSTAAPVTSEYPIDLVPTERLAGEVTLKAAREQVQFPVRLPTYPPGLGLPDRVYVQEMDGDLLVLVWNDPNDPEHPVLSLHMIAPGSWAITKVQPQVVQETTVAGRPAVWAVGPYLLQLENGDLQIGRLVEGNVLIWELDGLTYRLETVLPLEEALKIAESLE